MLMSMSILASLSRSEVGVLWCTYITSLSLSFSTYNISQVFWCVCVCVCVYVMFVCSLKRTEFASHQFFQIFDEKSRCSNDRIRWIIYETRERANNKTMHFNRFYCNRILSCWCWCVCSDVLVLVFFFVSQKNKTEKKCY